MMPSNYIFKCTNCQKTQKRYRNVKKCTACGGLLERVEYLEEGQLIHRHGYKMNRDGHFDVVREEDLAELESAFTTAQEENKRYKDALEEIANGHRPADDIASGALHPDNYDALIPDEYKNGQLFIAGIPVYVCYSTPDNTVLLGYATKEDAVKMARVLSNLIQSALNGGKNG
jgi:hypothetical protein